MLAWDVVSAASGAHGGCRGVPAAWMYLVSLDCRCCRKYWADISLAAAPCASIKPLPRACRERLDDERDVASCVAVCYVRRSLMYASEFWPVRVLCLRCYIISWNSRVFHVRDQTLEAKVRPHFVDFHSPGIPREYRRLDCANTDIRRT